MEVNKILLGLGLFIAVYVAIRLFLTQPKETFEDELDRILTSEKGRVKGRFE